MSGPTKEDIFEFIKTDLKTHPMGNKVPITPELTAKDAGLDSLDEVELIIALECEYDIDIDNDQAEACKTLQGLVDLVYTATR